jgi:hypothetical protein
MVFIVFKDRLTPGSSDETPAVDPILSTQSAQ